jgi:hypothetical protein
MKAKILLSVEKLRTCKPDGPDQASTEQEAQKVKLRSSASFLHWQPTALYFPKRAEGVNNYFGVQLRNLPLPRTAIQVCDLIPLAAAKSIELDIKKHATGRKSNTRRVP